MIDITQPEIIIVAIITTVFSAITGFFTWLFGRRKSDAEIAEISARVCNTLLEPLDMRVSKQNDLISKLRIYVEQLESMLIDSNVIKRSELEDMKNGIGL